MTPLPHRSGNSQELIYAEAPVFLRPVQALIYVFALRICRRKETAMRQAILAIVGAGGVVLLAGAVRNRGFYLADQVCAKGAILCDNPGWVLVSCAVLVFVATIHTIAKT